MLIFLKYAITPLTTFTPKCNEKIFKLVCKTTQTCMYTFNILSITPLKLHLMCSGSNSRAYKHTVHLLHKRMQNMNTVLVIEISNKLLTNCNDEIIKTNVGSTWNPHSGICGSDVEPS